VGVTAVREFARHRLRRAAYVGVPRAVVEQMMQQEAMRVRLHGLSPPPPLPSSSTYLLLLSPPPLTSSSSIRVLSVSKRVTRTYFRVVLAL
jgi:hypothetical protein